MKDHHSHFPTSMHQSNKPFKSKHSTKVWQPSQLRTNEETLLSLEFFRVLNPSWLASCVYVKLLGSVEGSEQGKGEPFQGDIRWQRTNIKV